MTTSRPRQNPPRPGRRPRGAPLPHRRDSFVQRNRGPLLWGGALALGAVVVGLAYLNLTSPAYACTQIWEPSPAPTIAPGTTPAPGQTVPPVVGYVQPDMGNQHVAGGAFVQYLHCPPASGRHYSGAGIGPIRAQLYGPEEKTIPQGWIHNLEHGGLVLLYKCPGEACDAAGQAALEQLYREFPPSPLCGFERGQVSPVITRFDDMAWPYAALVWDVVLPLEAFDRQAVLDFYAAYAERFNPEPLCPRPTPTPGPTGTPGPTASPDESPADSPAASPAESPAPSPS